MRRTVLDSSEHPLFGPAISRDLSGSATLQIDCKCKQVLRHQWRLPSSNRESLAPPTLAAAAAPPSTTATSDFSQRAPWAVAPAKRCLVRRARARARTWRSPLLFAMPPRGPRDGPRGHAWCLDGVRRPLTRRRRLALIQALHRGRSRSMYEHALEVEKKSDTNPPRAVGRCPGTPGAHVPLGGSRRARDRHR